MGRDCSMTPNPKPAKVPRAEWTPLERELDRLVERLPDGVSVVVEYREREFWEFLVRHGKTEVDRMWERIR